jgi:DNA-binding MarR family transcriptional regulator
MLASRAPNRTILRLFALLAGSPWTVARYCVTFLTLTVAERYGVLTRLDAPAERAEREAMEPYHAPTATSIGRQFITTLARSDETCSYTIRQLALLLALPSYGAHADFQVVRSALQAPQASVTQAIKKLVACGLVARRDNPVDRRRSDISLTLKGEMWIQEHLVVRGLT